MLKCKRRRFADDRSPSQPRVPAGNGRISGRWSDPSLGNGDRPRVTITRTNEDSEAIGDGGSGDTDFSLPMGSIDFGDVGSEIDTLGLFDIKPREPRIDGVQLAGDVPPLQRIHPESTYQSDPKAERSLE